jgi:hypothetical protein
MEEALEQVLHLATERGDNPQSCDDDAPFHLH